MLRKDLVLVSVIVAILALMVIPLNQTVIDVLLAINMSLAVLLLMVAIYLKHPSDFSTFPSVILLGTAFRLALSIGTTRLILSEADAGQIIETFGDFVVSGSIAIGLVIFLIITVVQFLVVTKGAERVAEVGARFALDALPGKQMSIDADIRSGALDREVGQAMRKRLDKDSQFFGAMDGAMKFVKGDAIAGIIIIVINLLGGIAVGVSIHGYSIGEAVSVFSLLTVGDGLVAQIPALMMSLCAGIIVTRVANVENDDLGTDIGKELIADVRVPAVAACLVLAMGFIPGFPLAIFACAAATLLTTALLLRRAVRIREAVQKVEELNASVENAEVAPEQDTINYSKRFCARVGRDVAAQFRISDAQSASDALFARFSGLRGVAFPHAQIVGDDSIPPDTILIDLDEIPVRRLNIPKGCILVDGDADLLPLVGCDVADTTAVDWPTFRGIWVPSEHAQALSRIDADIARVETVLAQAVFRIYEQNLAALFSRVEFDAVMADARAIDPTGTAAIEEALPALSIFQVLRSLVEDGVPLRPLTLLIDAFQYWLHTHENPTPSLLAECLRGSMKRQLCHLIAGPQNVIGVAMIDPALENLARRSILEAKRAGTSVSNDGLIFTTEMAEDILSQFRNLVHGSRKDGPQLAVVTATDIRLRLRNFLAANDIHLPVLAAHEISNDVATCPIELIGLPGAKLGQRSKPIAQARATIAAE